MNAPDQTMHLPDVQSSTDPRRLAITRVGIKDLRYPLRIAADGGAVTAVAQVSMYVGLPAERKGTHMSRFIEVLERQLEPIGVASLPQVLESMLAHLEAQDGSIEIRFPYFIRKRAPVSGVASYLDYEVTLAASRDAGSLRLRQQVVVPVTSLCPCSKEISAYGAHNQRTHVTIDLDLAQPVPIEEQVRFAEDAASCELWAVLKRSDEKFVTERAYDHPQFVEDTVREVALALQADQRILAYRVASENFEAIHNHSAYAVIERDKRGER